ncbi:8001_t:CDS:1, partial [Funneliformis geosporum]
EVNRNIERLGVCNFHMNLDKRLDFHPSGLRSNIDPSFAMISSKRCLFCGHCFYVYTRGTNCQTHAWRVIGKDILLPCLAIYTCKILDTHESIACKKLGLEEGYNYSRYICQTCINKNGGHAYISPGQGKKRESCDIKHKNEYTLGLQTIGNWILD